MNEKSKDMDEKSTRNSGKLKDVEGVTIERSIRMREGAKTKIHDKLIVLRKGSKVKVTKVKSKELVLQLFVVFLKCALEKGLEGFQQLPRN